MLDTGREAAADLPDERDDDGETSRSAPIDARRIDGVSRSR